MSYQSRVIAHSPTLYWRLGEASGLPQDLSGNSRHATAQGGTYTRDVTGLIAEDDGALLISGAYAQRNDEAALDLNSHTMIAWVKPSALPGAGASMDIATKDGTYITRMINYAGVSPYFEYLTRVGGGYRTALSSVAPSTGSTYMVVGTYDGSNMRLYINGTLTATTAATGTVDNSANPFVIGAAWSGLSNAYFGTIDEVSLHSGVLTAGQILTLYTVGVNGDSRLSHRAAGIFGGKTMKVRVGGTFVDKPLLVRKSGSFV